MHHELKSLLWGALVAALVIAPPLARGETMPVPPAPPAASPAAVEQPGPAGDVHATVEAARAEAMAAAAEARAEAHRAAGEARDTIILAQAKNSAHGSEWATRPEESFNARTLRIDDVIGSVRIDVKPNGPMTVKASGSRIAVDSLDIRAADGVLRIEGTNQNISVWDWRRWFDFSNLNRDDRTRLQLQITVPRGAEVRIEDMIGNATIGDLNGPLRLEATATQARIGKVTRAQIEMNGSGRVDIAQVTNELKLEIAGSGKVTAGSVGALKADLAGSGDAVIGDIHGPLNLDITGSGNLTATKVNGPLNISIAGAGSVKIADGLADPFHVDIMGSGNVVFGGMAVDPKISALGSGSVRLKAYRGKLSSEGMANVKVGE